MSPIPKKAVLEITDAIAEGFAAGETSEEDFADNFEKLMKRAIVESFKTKFLLDAAKGFFDQFAELAKGGITTEELETLRAQWEILQSTALEEWNNVTEGMAALGINFGDVIDADRRGLQGAIRRELTEETGGELAGLMRKNSDDIRITRDLTSEGVGHLMKIEQNTEDTVGELKLAVIELKLIAANTIPIQTGRDLGT